MRYNNQQRGYNNQQRGYNNQQRGTNNLNNNKYKSVLYRFPKLELPYEHMTHKIVRGDIYIAIPKGQKYFAWYTYYKNKNTLFLININYKTGAIQNIEEAPSIFSNEFCLGTVLYGTIVYQNGIKCFVADNIFYYCGHNVYDEPFEYKLSLFSDMFSNHVSPYIYTKNQLCICMPMYETSYSKLAENISNVGYIIYNIQIRNLKGDTTYLNCSKVPDINYTATFLVRPDIQNDVYHLFLDKDEYYNIAYVPSYKSSVFLNALFRNIKENDNLDALEESDDEDEFENIAQDKFVNLNKQFKMKCIFSKKFKKWIPLEVINSSSSQDVSSINDIKKVEKIYQ
tara:strand:- start:254 stop:1273 length:1020 start_codon:yes stop_codon:yes gene_type:complete